MWEAIVSGCRDGHLLGCCKFAESMTGEKITKMGLAYNHAYGILRCEEYKGVRLICMRSFAKFSIITQMNFMFACQGLKAQFFDSR
jgi:hypothetical protein